MIQYELTNRSYSFIIACVVLIDYVFLRDRLYIFMNKWAVRVSVFILVLTILIDILLFWKYPEIYIKIPEDTDSQEAESKQDEGPVVLYEWKDGNRLYKIIYMEDTKVN